MNGTCGDEVQSSLRDEGHCMGFAYPAINRWAIVTRPFGTKDRVWGQLAFVVRFGAVAGILEFYPN